MTIPVYPTLKGLSYIFKGNPFNKATSTSGVETRGFQLQFRGNPFVINQNFTIEIDLTFQSSPSLSSSFEIHSGSLEFYSPLTLDIPPILPEIVNDFVFETDLSFQSIFDLEFPPLEFISLSELSFDFDFISPLPESFNLEFNSIPVFESDIDYAIVLVLMFDSVGQSETSLSILSPHFYDRIFENGLEIELDLECLSSLQTDFEFDFLIRNSITSQVSLDYDLINSILSYNEVEKNFITFNRIDPLQSFIYSGFYFSKIHGVS